DYPLGDVSVNDVVARTIHPDGSVLDLDRKSIHTQIVYKHHHEGVRQTSFAMPGVVPASIIEYRYHQRIWDESAHLFAFQHEIATQRSIYYFRPYPAPDWFIRQFNYHAVFTKSDQPVNGYYEIAAEDQPAYHEEPDSPPERQQLPWVLLYYTQEKL